MARGMRPPNPCRSSHQTTRHCFCLPNIPRGARLCRCRIPQSRSRRPIIRSCDVDLTDGKGLSGLVTFKVAVVFDAFSRMPSRRARHASDLLGEFSSLASQTIEILAAPLAVLTAESASTSGFRVFRAVPRSGTACAFSGSCWYERTSSIAV